MLLNIKNTFDKKHKKARKKKYEYKIKNAKGRK